MNTIFKSTSNSTSFELEYTEIEEEETISKKRKRIRITDYCLLSMIVVLSVVFIMVLFKVM